MEEGSCKMPRKRTPKEKIVILGTSLFAPEVLDLIEDTGRFEVTAFVENWDREKTKQTLIGRPIIWIDEAQRLASTHKAICSLGTTHRRQFIEQALGLGFQFVAVVHPSARLSKESSVGEGSILSAGVIVGSHTKVGKHVIVNRGCLIGHNTTIQDYVTLAPGANIAGVVTIGESTYIAMGAIVLDRITIGKQAVIGAGAVVTRDIPDRVQVTGIPAKVTKENIEGR
jgi:sugar O-acyltransferase (sialic acid O-acetyltransferase NeuD family)